MKSFNFTMLFFALAATFSIMLIGVFIAEKSLLGISLSIIGFIIVMGFGFVTKKKMRENGRL